MNNYQVRTLSNGSRLCLIPIDNSFSVTLSAFIKAGFQEDPKDLPGLAHFVEHMIFKGCQDYPTSVDLAQAVEKYGGWHNAWTGINYQQHTIHLPSERVEDGIKILINSLSKPLFNAEEIEKEKGVLNEEILQIKINPDRAIWDYAWQPLFYEGTDLSRPFSGTIDDVKRFTREDLVAFVERYFTPQATTFVIAGNISPDETIALFEKYAQEYTRKGESFNRTIELNSSNRVKVHSLDISQSTVMCGIKTVPYKNEERFAVEIIGDLLGGYYASRLPLNLRDKNGLIYDWSVFQHTLKDLGYWYFRFSTENTNVYKAIELVLAEFEKIGQGLIEEQDFMMAKDHLIGGIKANVQRAIDYVDWYGQQAILSEQIQSIDEVIEKYNALTIEDVREVGKKYFIRENMYIALVGQADEEKIQKLL